MRHCRQGRISRLGFLLCVLGAASTAGAAAQGLTIGGRPVSTLSAEPLTDRAKEALRRSTDYLRSLSTEGGYLWWYSEDLKERSGENKATASQIWIQTPGTPAMGMAFLRAYEVTGEPKYLQAAQAAAHALTVGQLQSGGWDYLIDFDPKESGKWYRRTDTAPVPKGKGTGRKNNSTFDDDNTQSALRFLLAFLDAQKQPGPEAASVRSAVEYGLTMMLEAQYPNGAWPQRYDAKRHDSAKFPVQAATIPRLYPREHGKVSYYSHYTLNDDTQRDCIRTMLDAYRRLGKPEYLQAAKRGGDFLILAQLPAPQSAWAQQYNASMEPAWARVFEPPSVSSRESAGAIRTLAELYRETGDAKYLRPIPAAIAWFKRSEIAPNKWARMYELHTNKPIYGDRDGKIHNTMEELSEERRTGYAWQAGFGVASAIAFYEEARAKGPQAQQKPQPAPKTRDIKTLEADAVRAVTALDARGRWLVNGRIQTRTYIENVNALCSYLEAAATAHTASR
ncbi:MAG: pectate lyase [Armatimonadota bacterium]